ncbi:diaminobutyrate acetyltransferase [Natronoglycomyces albus]|uniref:L-2,4-diaminobutyric acid acetyltransferase n=1 Tax=Natronoglycomyces albus TaxID=2811108 RepID=A0A895XMF3_9ACTN|nr:diaminobutyrate acetyltransferase [Natronoglycomyces albus]QSB04579.1 diaminobutyrate acetyltransferase [Natronoglycomyces albus]
MPLGENSDTGKGAQHYTADRQTAYSSADEFGDEAGEPEKRPTSPRNQGVENDATASASYGGTSRGTVHQNPAFENPAVQSGAEPGPNSTATDQPQLTFDQPTADDGAAIWHLVGEIGNLDLNSRYFYVLWGRDFAADSVVVRDGDRIAGFIVGYRRPESVDTLFVWQVAVSPHYRRQGLARRMLDHLWNRLRPLGVNFVESTVTPDNKASMRLFESFAEGHNAELTRDVLFSEQMLGEGHEPEVLHRIGPVPSDA